MDVDSVSLITSVHKALESVINNTDIAPQGQISEKKLQKPRQALSVLDTPFPKIYLYYFLG